MEEKIRSHQINWLPAILFAILPLMQLSGYIITQLSYPQAWSLNFAGYLRFLWFEAYILLALALITARKNKLFAFAFTLPVVISLISALLHYQKVLALLDLITYGSLYFVVLGATGFLPGCKKPARYLSLIPGIIRLIRQICSLPHTLIEALFAISCLIALLTTGIWAMEQTQEETPQPPVPVTKLPGIGLIMFGTLFLISRAVAVVLHYIEMLEIMETVGIYISKEGLYGASAIELLLCVIVSICAIYGGILLCHKKPPEND